MPKSPTEFDKILGIKIIQLRLDRGMTQKNLGDALGVSFQQIQKYESGKNRLSCATLEKISEVLEVPVMHFFSEDNNIVMHRPSREKLHLMQFLKDIEDPELVKILKKLMKHLGIIERRAGKG